MIVTTPRAQRPRIELFRFLAVTIACLAMLACGQSKRNAEPADDLGTPCGDSRPVVAGTVEIDAQASECQGVCLHSDAVAPPGTSSPGECTCRCDGPTGSGPFCTCAAGYACEQQMRDLGLGDSELTGSYCVPEP